MHKSKIETPEESIEDLEGKYKFLTPFIREPDREVGNQTSHRQLQKWAQAQTKN